MANELGSSGTLISAALQSSGYYYQSVILDDLGYYLTHPIAVLIFIFGAVVAMARFVFEQDTKMIKWLLIGPVVFSAVLSSRTPVTNAQWRFGDRIYNDSIVQKNFTTSLPAHYRRQTAPKAEVASLFAAYNRLTSQIVQSIVQTLSSLRKDIDTKFIIRAELLSALKGSTVGEPDLRDLIQTAFLGNCRQMVTVARDMSDLRTPPKVREQKVKEAEKKEKSKEQKEEGKKEETKEQTEQREREELEQQARERYEQIAQGMQAQMRNAASTRQNLSPGARRWVELYQKEDPALFCLATLGTTEQISTELTKRFVDKSGATQRPALTTECEQSLKMDLAGESLSCGQIWNFVYSGVYIYAPTVVSNIVETGKRNGVAPNDLVRNLLDAKGFETQSDSHIQGEQFNSLVRVAAHYLLKNELQRTSLSSFINRYINRGFEFKLLRGMSESDLSLVERDRMRNNEWQEKLKMVFTASLLPYYQGVVQFFLAILFPFFALLLIFPGHYGKFIQWFILWLWVKSWDIGFAVVMFFDDILFNIYSHGANVLGVERSVTLNPDMNATLEAFRALDPTMQLGTYYTLMAMAVGGIPIISSYLILGSLKGGAGLIASGAQSFAQIFASRASMMEGQGLVSGARFRGAEVEHTTAQKYIDNLMKGRPQTSGANMDYPNPGAAMSGFEPRYSPSMPLEELRDRIMQQVPIAAKAGAMASGTQVYGSVNSLNPLLSLPIIATLRSALNSGVRARGTIDSAIEGQRLEEYNAHFRENLSKYVASAGYDALNSEEVQRLHVRGAINRQLFIPLLKKDGFVQELAHEQVGWQQYLKRLAAPIRGVSNAVGQGVWGAVVAGLSGAGGAYYESRRRLNQLAAASNVGPSVFPVEVNIGALSTPFAGGGVATSPWGPRINPETKKYEVHPGLDIGLNFGTPILAAAPGTVVWKGNIGSKDRGYGNVVILRHQRNGTTFYTLYAHGSSFPPGIEVGQSVGVGTPILRAGSTGLSSGDHLHFEVAIERGGQLLNVNPAAFLDGAGSATVYAREQPWLTAGEMRER